MSNKLYFGDNLHILRRYIKHESIDLIYLDPPFNSNTNYNVLFKPSVARGHRAQIQAFDDTWKWGEETERTFDEIAEHGGSVAVIVEALKFSLGRSDVMAYIVMMTIRLIELHRVLKPTGSLYLHCDPTASHYLKIILDTVFGVSNYINEVSWHRTTAKADYQQGAMHFPRVRDVVLRYAKSASEGFVFNQDFVQYDAEYVASKYRYKDADGRLYRLDNLTGPGGEAKGNAFYEVMGVSHYWRYSRENMDRLIAEGRVIQTNPGTVPQYKRYLDEMPGVPISDDWQNIRPITLKLMKG